MNDQPDLPFEGTRKMTRLETITANAFVLPSLATKHERYIGHAIRANAIAGGHWGKLPPNPQTLGTQRGEAQVLSNNAVVKYMRTRPKYKTTQRGICDALVGIIRPSAVRGALRNMIVDGRVIRTTTGANTRVWFELAEYEGEE